jgi:hypothetical protein
MATSLSVNLDFISKEASLYFGIPVLIGGTIGGFLNIIVFLSLRTFRQNSCAFYLTIMSIVNIGQLLTGLLTRIMTTGFGIDWAQASLVYCKFRYFVFSITSLISFTLFCLATIDQYFATCSRPQWQRWCNIKLAYRLTAFFVILWTLHSIPYLLLYEHISSPDSNKTICTAPNNIFLEYRTYFISLILIGFLPICITIISGSLAYCNVRTIAYRTVPLVRRELDKQLTVMVLTQVVVHCFTVLPFSIMNVLSLNTSLTNGLITTAEIKFTSFISVLVYYIYFGVSIYE